MLNKGKNKDINRYNNFDILVCFLLLCASITLIFTIIGIRVKIDRDIYDEVSVLSKNKKFEDFFDKVLFNSHGVYKSKEYINRKKYKKFDFLENERKEQAQFDKVRRQYVNL
ncbi:hypothetical protein EHP00_1289 [Ecytonucleospora hepatopenaei]|uniref:Uncharacterized protein n=1 Tax=Ecytonucleospora hepatopenaei TaxID=646526 RepID=A0A1W0E6Y0_9MICR|nr:hypothetical protein EHP00_1289 [Ecytonucleospora hepatopenaei]